MQSDGGSWKEALDLRLISCLIKGVGRDLHYGIGRIQIRFPIITGRRLVRRGYAEGHFVVVRRRSVGKIDRPCRRDWWILRLVRFIVFRFLSIRMKCRLLKYEIHFIKKNPLKQWSELQWWAWGRCIGKEQSKRLSKIWHRAWNLKRV